MRTAGERLRMDTVRMCRETDDKTKRTQADVGKRLGERIGDIQFWKVCQHHVNIMSIIIFILNIEHFHSQIVLILTLTLPVADG